MTTYVWEVAWSNPHRPRPEDVPEVVLRLVVEAPGAQCPTEIHACWEEMRPYGYAVRVLVETPEPRRLPLAMKQRIRRRNLWKRLLSRRPLLAHAWYAEDVQAKPDYYGPYTAGEFADERYARTTLGYLRREDRHDPNT